MKKGGKKSREEGLVAVAVLVQGLFGFIIPDHPAFTHDPEESATLLFAGKLDEGVDAPIASALRVHSLWT
jgi:hypothetical protein